MIKVHFTLLYYLCTCINQSKIFYNIKRPDLLFVLKPLHNELLDVAARLGMSDKDFISQLRHQFVPLIGGFLCNTSNCKLEWRDDEQAVLRQCCRQLWLKSLFQAAGQRQNDWLVPLKQVMKNIFLNLGVIPRNDTNPLISPPSGPVIGP